MPARRRRRSRDMPEGPAPVRPDFGGIVTKPSERRRWRRQVRPEILHRALDGTSAMSWSAVLLELLVDEMYVGDALEELLGTSLHSLDVSRYPQAVALALVLRHSWQPDDLEYVLDQLGLSADVMSDE